MGVGGKFWDLIKPYARHEGADFLRGKQVAVDLSNWIIQHETAVGSHVYNAHLRFTFFRIISLFSKFGAFPVFVLDGDPSLLKYRAMVARYSRLSGIAISKLQVDEVGSSCSKEKNWAIVKHVQECMELLELFGMPVLKANGEAEALCAQLNYEGYVNACITSDSDAFLFGAKCVIKCLRPNTKEPFECYQMSDIEDGLGLKRKHLIAISLLVGSDHDLNGVHGIEVDKACRFVQTFSEDDVLNSLHEISKGNTYLIQSVSRVVENYVEHGSIGKAKPSHCSFCGHPWSKKLHLKSSCNDCSTSNRQSCTKKLEGFKFDCSLCNKEFGPKKPYVQLTDWVEYKQRSSY